MAQFINAAKLVRYNANVRGNDSGDCVCRAISLAFDISYSTAGKYLNQKMREVRENIWNIPKVFGPVIQELGGDSARSQSPYITVDEFADIHPSGCYICQCGEKAIGIKTTHLVCIIDGVIYDSWDCRSHYVKTYYSVNNNRHIESIDIEDYAEELKRYAESTTDELLSKYYDKWLMNIDESVHLSAELSNTATYRMNFAINYVGKFKYQISDETGRTDVPRKIQFIIVYTLKPGMALKDAKAYILKTAKQRAYDRMYSIRDKVKQDIEAFNAAFDAGSLSNGPSFISRAAERFLSQLPGKIRPYIIDIQIEKPGQYSNSYYVRLKGLPQDPNKNSPFNITAYDSNSAKQMIKRYLETYERPYVDYSPHDEY